MAAVYLADWPHMDLRIAIKVMDPYLLDQETAVQRFLQEARTIAKLKHRHIIRVYDSGTAGDLYFFCMDYYSGRSLERVLAAEGQISIEVAKVWLWQAADALGYAHRQAKPVVHRDVKPSNILLDAEGDLVLTDFGIAKVRDVESTSGGISLTMPGAVLGTPAYLSPEQASAILSPGGVSKGSLVTSASDQYSLGVVAYEMLTGEPPFTGELGPLLTCHAREEPVPILEKRPDCPRELAEAVTRMLAKRPQDRWPSMHDLCAAVAASSPPPGSPLRTQLSALAKGHQPVGTISFSPVPGSLFEGQDFKIDATPLDLGGRPLRDRRLSWTSSDPDIALVTPDGVVKALRAGAVSITATADGISQEIELAVAPTPIDTVVLLPSELSLAAGETATFRTLLLSREGRELEGRPVTWTTSDPKVATVNAEGVLSARAVGTVTVTASSGKRSGSASVKVIPPAVASVEISPRDLSLEAGDAANVQAAPLDAQGEPLEGRALTWESGDPSTVRVEGEGRVVALAAGKTVVRAICEGVRAEASVVVTPERVRALLLSPESPNVQEGETLQLEAAAHSARGTLLRGRTIHWESNEAEIVAVDEKGLAQGIRPGSVEVRARCEDVQASVTVQVTAAPVASMEIFPGSISMQLGEPRPLVAVVRGPGGETLWGRAIMWSTSDPSIATVSAEGVIHPIAVGRVRVTASCEEQSADAEVTVAPPPVAHIELEEESLSLQGGEEYTIVPVLRAGDGSVLAGRSVSWRSSHPDIVEVDSSGRLVARSEGSSAIQIQCEDVSITVSVVVVPEKAASLLLSSSTVQLAEGESQRADATPVGKSGDPLQGRQLLWSSDHPDVAQVTPDGTITGMSPGQTVIRASLDLARAEVSVTVSPAPIASLEIHPAELSLAVGESAQMQAVARSPGGSPLEGRSLSWASSDPTLAEVSREGRVTARAEGRVAIQVKAEGRSAEAVLTVEPEKVASLVVESPVSSLMEGETVQLQAKVLGTSGEVISGRPLEWRSSTLELAQVGPDGTVRALAPGKVSLFARCEGKEAAVTLRIEPAAVDSVEISLAAPTIMEGEEAPIHCVLKDRQGRELKGRPVAWNSSDPSVVRIGRDGRMQAVSPGTVSIDASCEGQRQQIQVRVEPQPVAGLEMDVRKKGLRVGEARRLHAVPKAPNGTALKSRPLEWESSDPGVAEVDRSGQVRGVAQGVVSITASCEGKTASVTMEVLSSRAGIRPGIVVGAGVAFVAAALAIWRPWTSGPEPPTPEPPASPVLTAMAILPGDSITLAPGDGLELHLTARDETGASLSEEALPPPRWEISDGNVATISQTGVLLASAPGRARISATVSPPAGGSPLSASATLVVTEVSETEVGEVEPPPVETGRAGQPTEERAQQPPSRGNEPRQPEPAVSAIHLAPPRGEVQEGETLPLGLTDQNGNPVAGTFRSSDPTVATVSSSGLLSALRAGTVTVTASYRNLSTQAEIRVAAAVRDPPAALLDSIRESVAQVLERASLAEYEIAYQLLDSIGVQIDRLEERYAGSALVAPLQAEYLEAFSSTFDGCQRFRQVMEQRGIQDLPTCRPPPTGVGNDAVLSLHPGSLSAHFGASRHTPSLAGPGALALHP